MRADEQGEEAVALTAGPSSSPRVEGLHPGARRQRTEREEHRRPCLRRDKIGGRSSRFGNSSIRNPTCSYLHLYCLYSTSIDTGWIPNYW